MKRKNLVLVFVIAAALIIAAGAALSQQKLDVSGLYKEIELFSDAISLINANYVDAIKPKDLIYGALKGMLSSLDGYSQFMDPESFEEMKVDTKGKFGGLGIEISVKDDILTIIAPIAGTPADEAGIKPGDTIVKIDGEVTQNISLHDSVNKLRGKPGTKVTLTIWRESEERLFDVTIARKIIEIKSVKEARIIDDDIAYIKLAEFQEGSVKEFEDALKSLKANTRKGLILDLRNNPGGLLDASIGVSDILLGKDKIIVSTKGRGPSQCREYKSVRSTDYQNVTLAVLVNEGSASASEIVAGAIKDNLRGVVIGRKTFGKASVQTVAPLSDGSALRITTAKYLTPKGRSISETGIAPDVILEPVEKAKKEEERKDIFKKIEEKKRDTLDLDSEIKAAIGIIKGVNIYKKES